MQFPGGVEISVQRFMKKQVYRLLHSHATIDFIVGSFAHDESCSIIIQDRYKTQIPDWTMDLIMN